MKLYVSYLCTRSYKMLEPRYQAAMAQQKKQIKLLEKELSSSEQQQILAIAAERDAMEQEIAAARSEMEIVLEEKVGADEEVAALLERLHGLEKALAMVTAQRDARALAVTTSNRQVQQLERELVEVIRARQLADERLVEESGTHMSLELQARNGSATVATLLSTLGMRSRSVAVDPEELQQLQLTKTTGGRELIKVLGNSASPTPEPGLMVEKPPMYDELRAGDVVVGIRGAMVHELSHAEALAQLTAPSNGPLFVVVTDEASVQVVDEDGDNDGDDGDDGDGGGALAVLLGPSTAKVGMAVVVEASLLDSTVPLYQSVLQCDGQTGFIKTINSTGSNCQVRTCDDVAAVDAGGAWK
jgi:hypothetical protein